MVKEEEYLLTNQEILGGLKSALERGQTLKQAMMSFYQAGYKKEEIEDAARAYLYLQKGVSEAQVLNEGKVKTAEENKTVKSQEKISPQKDEKIISKIAETKVPGGFLEMKKEEPKKVVQKISGYESKPVKPINAKSKALTVVLVVTLAVLLGILALVFLFKSELVNFINGLFG